MERVMERMWSHLLLAIVAYGLVRFYMAFALMLTVDTVEEHASAVFFTAWSVYLSKYFNR
jgi:hypothetical protein